MLMSNDPLSLHSLFYFFFEEKSDLIHTVDCAKECRGRDGSAPIFSRSLSSMPAPVIKQTNNHHLQNTSHCSVAAKAIKKKGEKSFIAHDHLNLIQEQMR